MVPTYFRRCSGIECSNGHCGFALLFADGFVASPDAFVFESVIQYAAVSRLYHWRSGILDHPLSRVMTNIETAAKT
jgi:hypothetical protein